MTEVRPLYIGIEAMRTLIQREGVDHFLDHLTRYMAEDFARWDEFDKSPRTAAHSPLGVVELMPAADASLFSFKYVNGHPANALNDLQTVVAFGALSRMDTGYPVLISEMTLLTALRTAAASALAARYLIRAGSHTMALIGNGAQSEFQALAFKQLLGVERFRLYDVDPVASRKCLDNLNSAGLDAVICPSPEEAIEGAQIITTATADKRKAVIISGNMVGSGIHINAIGGDCPGKTEIAKAVLERARIFVEYEPQTRVEGEIQQLAPDHPVSELHRVIAGTEPGRRDRDEITIFDSVGFAIEDYSALRLVNDLAVRNDIGRRLDIIPDNLDPKNLFGMLKDSKRH